MISRKDKFKALGFLIAAVAGLASCGLADALLTKSPTWLLVILIALTAVQMLMIVFGVYSSRFWERWPKTGRAIFLWGIAVLVLASLVVIDISVVSMGVREMWLQQFGEVAEGTIVDRQVLSRNGASPREYHRFTYQWIATGNSSEIRQYTGKVNSSLNWSSHTVPGTRITVRYLPSAPTISRVEEDFASSPVNDVGFALFVNVYVILSGIALILGRRVRIKNSSQEMNSSVEPLPDV